ncbi:MAG: Sua5/YciO/YrdC/YwlC family protein [Psittacicella sp.]
MGKVLEINSQNPQKRLIDMVIKEIKNNSLIILSLESGYMLATSINNKSGIEKIRTLRKFKDGDNLTLICKDIKEASVYLDIDNNAFKYIKGSSNDCSFILNSKKTLPNFVNSKNKTLGLRLSSYPVFLEIVDILGEPLVGASLIIKNDDILELQYDPDEIMEIFLNKVDLIINTGYSTNKIVDIVNLTNSTIEVLR